MKIVRDSDTNEEAPTAGAQPLLRDLRSIGHHARQLQHNAATLATEVQSASDDLERYVTDRVRRQPYSTLGAAAGIGYVLGGGLRSSLTMMMLGAAARIVAGQLVRELSSMAGQMGSRPVPPEPAGTPALEPVT